jgi:hypothetical protein
LAAFTEDEINEHWNVWDLFQNGGVVLFKQRDILDAAADQLRSCGYQVRNIDCHLNDDQESLLKAIVDALGIPRYPNIGLDGFNDFISQIDFGSSTGVIVLPA